jgi:hypothetical protein
MGKIVNMNNDLDDAWRRVENIRVHLPSSISFADLGVQSKAPYLFLCIRAALAWRTEELARCACNALAKNNIASGILLTRAVIESAAFIWRLKEFLEERCKYTSDDLCNNLEKMFLGWKDDPDFPKVYSILTALDHMNKQFPGVRERYNELSEFAHPNWSGVSGLFSVIDRETGTAKFGRGLRRTPAAAKKTAAAALRGYLELFEQVYKWISDTLPKFIAELESL